VNEKLIFGLPALLSRHVVAKLKAKEKLQSLERAILVSVVAEQKLSDYLAPLGALSCCIYEVVAIVGQQSTEIHHGSLY
jgi:hypothetical protein